MPGAVVVATGEVGEVVVERGGPLRVVGYAARELVGEDADALLGRSKSWPELLTRA
jgi:hypothetical protein